MGATAADQGSVKALVRLQIKALLRLWYKQVWVLPLHSSLPQADQLKVFERAPKNVRKVVLATNVAGMSP